MEPMGANYSRGKQFNLLQRLGFESPSWADLSYVLGGLFSAAALAGAGWALWISGRTPGSACRPACATVWIPWGSTWPCMTDRGGAPRVCATSWGLRAEPLAALLE